MHNAARRLQPIKGTLNYPVTIELSFVNKKSQVVEIVELWRLDFCLEKMSSSCDAYSKGSPWVKLVKQYFEELYELLTHMPFWENYWKDNIVHRVTKLTHVLNYKISFTGEPLSDEFNYEEKCQRLK
jgi:hypothetical protein